MLRQRARIRNLVFDVPLLSFMRISVCKRYITIFIYQVCFTQHHNVENLDLAIDILFKPHSGSMKWFG
jgi:hypothetical protein